MSGRRILVRALLLLTLGAVTVTANGQQERPFESGWYAGGGLSYNDIYIYDDVCWGCYGTAEYGRSGTSASLTVGLRATRFLAIEGSYISESSLRWDRNLVMFDNFFDPYTVDADIDLASYQLSALAIAAGRYWEAYLKLGLAFWDARSDLTTTWLTTGEQVAQNLDRRGNGLLIGIGGGRSFGKDWQARLDYGYFAIDDSLLGLDGNFEAYADYATLQIIKRFGRE